MKRNEGDLEVLIGMWIIGICAVVWVVVETTELVLRIKDVL